MKIINERIVTILRSKYMNNEEIEVCNISLKNLLNNTSKCLEYKLNGEWYRLVPPRLDYKNYKYTLCETHKQEIYYGAMR